MFEHLKESRGTHSDGRWRRTGPELGFLSSYMDIAACAVYVLKKLCTSVLRQLSIHNR